MLRVNLLRIVVFGLVIAIAAIGVAGALDTTGGPSSATRAELAAKVAALEQAAKRPGRHVRRGPRGRRGRQGERGPQGAPGTRGAAGASGTDQVIDLSVNWRNGQWPGRDTASAAIPQIGTLTLACNPGQLRLTLSETAVGARTIANATTFQGAGTGAAANSRFQSTGPADPIVIDRDATGQPFPPNGMMIATFSVEPTSGDGGGGPPPATLSLTSYHPGPADDYCFISGQVIVRGG